MTNPTVYIVLNTELHMSPGKAAAQSVHAAMMLNTTARDLFTEEYRRSVIVLGGTTEQIKNLYTYLDETGIYHDYYIDEGVNEVEAYSVTALAAFVNDDDEREIFAPFNLYHGSPTGLWEERFHIGKFKFMKYRGFDR